MLFLVFRKSEGRFLSAIINIDISIVNTFLLMQKFRCRDSIDSAKIRTD